MTVALPKTFNRPETADRAVSIALRVAFAVAFTYVPIAALITPEAWVGFIPVRVRDVLPNDYALLHAIGAAELALSAWVLFGKNVRIPAALGAMLLLGIMASNFQFTDVVFRDFAIFCAVIALCIRGR